MRRRAFRALCCSGLLLAGVDARAQAPSAQAPGARTWSFTAAAATYFVPDDSDYVQPSVIADRGKLHLEARYNYEAHKTASAWIGYNLSFGETVTFDLTPVVGGVFGDTSGIAPGYKLALAWRNIELSSESEYVFDAGSSSDNFFYTWSEVAWAPTDWSRFGLVVQRTRAYQTEFDIQRGLLAGFSWKKASLTAYVFNPDEGKPTVVVSLGFDF